MTLRPLLVSTFDLEGGAARAAHRLHRGLLQDGLASQLLVQLQDSDTEGVIGPTSRRQRAWARARPVLDGSVLAAYPRRPEAMFSAAWLPGGAAPKIGRIEHDVLNLHWTAAGFLSIEGVPTQGKPLVWTLHDMWAFTGGCHYAGGCDGYLRRCGRCPWLGSGAEWDLSRIGWMRKLRSWRHLRPVFVTPTNWLASAARNSSLIENAAIEVIPNGVDTKQFQPLDRYACREALGLPHDKVLVAFGALSLSEPRKGSALLSKALEKLGERVSPDSVELVVFGASRPPDQATIPLSTHYTGRLTDDVSLAVLYAAVDTMVVPSLYEAQSLVAIEAMACGTPCVAFEVEGLSEVIDDGRNGRLVPPFDTSVLADAIAELITNESLRSLNGSNARAKALETWDLGLVATQYRELYESLV